MSKYDNYPGKWKEGVTEVLAVLLAVIAFALFVWPGLILFFF